MYNPDFIDLTQRFLFSTEEEMAEAKIPKNQQQRILRVRDMYMYWLKHPQHGDRAIVNQLIYQYKVAQKVAYDDLHLIKICLGNINQVTRQWCQYVFLQRCEEGFAMARAKNDAKAFGNILSTFARFTRLDKDEQTALEYDQIVPQQFEITTDPAVAGFERIPNIEQKVQKLFDRYKCEAEQADAVELLTPNS